MSIKVKDVIAMLEANGWRQARMNGDHRVFVKPGARRSIIVAGHPAKDMPVGTAKSIERQMRDFSIIYEA